MRPRLGFAVGLTLALAAAVHAETAPGEWQASGTHGVVVAGGRDATRAGLSVLKAGGNAVDAAVATVLALSVTDSEKFAFGSEVTFMLFDARRRAVEVLAGQGAAPALATRAHFLQPRPGEGEGIPGKGLAAAAVPAVLDALVTALERNGTITFTAATAPTLALLDRGAKPWHADLARTLRRLCAAEASAAGDRVRGLRLVADTFYRGEIARAIDAWSRAQGGLLRFSDLATHSTRVEDPVSITYRGRVVYKAGPWTQGPYVLEALQLLEGWDLRALPRADALHLVIEATKLALADRDVFYGDPHFVEVPLGALLAPSYARARRALVDPNVASLVQRPGDPWRGKPLLERAEARRGLGGPSLDTTTCVVADEAGNVVAATPSGWSGVLAGATGVWLGTRLQSFNLWEGHPNVIAPGKRPRITLTPTLVLEGGKPVIALSVAGGDAQDQYTLQLLVDLIDLGMTPPQAVTGGFFVSNHHVGSFRQTPPALGALDVNGFPPAIEAALRAKGHRLATKARPALGEPAVLVIDPKTGRMTGVGDPLTNRHAAGY